MKPAPYSAGGCGATGITFAEGRMIGFQNLHDLNLSNNLPPEVAAKSCNDFLNRFCNFRQLQSPCHSFEHLQICSV